MADSKDKFSLTILGVVAIVGIVAIFFGYFGMLKLNLPNKDLAGKATDALWPIFTNPNVLIPAQEYTVYWSTPAGYTPRAGDWIALVRADITEWPGDGTIAWFYTNGAAEGSSAGKYVYNSPGGKLVAPSTPGRYVLWYNRDEVGLIAKSAPIGIGVADTDVAPILTMNFSSPVLTAGQEYSVSWKNTGTVRAGDWIALVRADITEWPGDGTIAWFYTNGAAEGSSAGKYVYNSPGGKLVAPSTPGRYVLWYNRDEVGLIAKSAPIDVGTAAASVITMNVSKTKLVIGEEYTITWNNPGTSRPNDWIALSPKDNPWPGDGSLGWFYAGAEKSGTSVGKYAYNTRDNVLRAPLKTGFYEVTYNREGYNQPIAIGAVVEVVTAESLYDFQINSCTEITSSGSYIVTNNLETSLNGVACLYLHDTADIKLDCNKKTINGNGMLFSGQNGVAVAIKNVKRFNITNCIMGSPTNPDKGTIAISDSESGILKSNTFGNSIVDVRSSSNLEFSDNTFTSYYQQSHSRGIKIESNLFDLNLDLAPAVIWLGHGSNNIVRKNTIDGNWNGARTLDFGSDGGIHLFNDTNNLLENNIIQNNWGCGIETIGTITNTRIIGNTIRNSGLCGIGGWYNFGWRSNLVSDNYIENAPRLFWIFRVNGLWNYEEKLYFTDNTFKNNKYSNPINTVLRSSEFDLVKVHYQDQMRVGERIIEPEDLAVYNNRFYNNDFGKSDTLLINPQYMAIDGGGNRCLPPSLNFTISCS